MLGFLGVEATDRNAERFDKLLKCKRCGACCSAVLFKTGVLLFPQEVERLSIRAGVSKRQFKDKYSYTEDGRRFLKLPCPFYKDGECSVYSVRPLVCREFPLNQIVPKNGRMWMTVNMDCPAGKELGNKYAVKVQV